MFPKYVFKLAKMFSLSWDLFIIVFFTVIIAYSFIIGKNQTLKVIVGTYIAILTADGLGNIVQHYLLEPTPLLKALSVEANDKALIFFKVVVFISTIVIISVKGGFEVNISNEKSGWLRAITTFICGFLNAGLIISTVLIYVSGMSFIQGELDITNNFIFGLYEQSELVRLMINNYNLWFFLPALTFVFFSFVQEEREAE